MDLLSYLRPEEFNIEGQWLSEKCRPEQQFSYLEDRAASGVDDPQSLVLANGADGAAVRVPADAVDQVWVGVAQLVDQLPSAHIPHTQHVITAWRERGKCTILDGSADTSGMTYVTVILFTNTDKLMEKYLCVLSIFRITYFLTPHSSGLAWIINHPRNLMLCGTSSETPGHCHPGVLSAPLRREHHWGVWGICDMTSVRQLHLFGRAIQFQSTTHTNN